ncbi:TPA: leucine-rich repeat domain-containing protein [Escherichia coli]|nr:leucine-rich repeat domain-containing protein [Escherichia coli]RNI64873.1 leucine-rich repeat domain-containing protein [Escherichia coli]HDY2988886.1 leucine-rich repeat domain-containing protein [Escherichia coli]
MPETTNLFNCGDNKIKKIQYFPNHLETARMEYNIEVVPAIHSNLKLLFIECYPIKEEFLMPWTLTDITYEISQRKYIVTNSADYDKYSDIVKRGVIDGKN